MSLKGQAIRQLRQGKPNPTDRFSIPISCPEFDY